MSWARFLAQYLMKISILNKWVDKDEEEDIASANMF
jgi:hypothetical protein